MHGFWEQERFTDTSVPSAERGGGSVRWSNWISPVVRFGADIGFEDWEAFGAAGRSRADLRFVSRGSRLTLRGGGETWWGSEAFSRADVGVTAISSRSRAGTVYVARASASTGSSNLPPLLWFGADTGQARDTLLRAHPLVDDGRLRVEQLGRQMVNASMEVQRWWAPGLLRAGGAAFIDAARTARRVDGDARGDVDAGVGFRAALPGVAGIIRADVATGLLHGGTRWSFVYEPGN